MTENEINMKAKSIKCKSSDGNDMQISGNEQQKIRSIMYVDL